VLYFSGTHIISGINIDLKIHEMCVASGKQNDWTGNFVF